MRASGKRVLSVLAGAAGLVGLSYAVYATATWIGYGRSTHGKDAEARDALLDRFIPTYEVAERHAARVAAPAEVTYAAACALELQRSPIIRAIFRGRELLMGATPAQDAGPRALVPQMLALGWGILDEAPGRELVMGAVTQPWRADVHFRALPPSEFLAFHEPGYAKIVWTLSAEPLGPSESVARTETRVATTDPESRQRFRRYWALLSPGILLIRREALRLVKADAEQRARTAR
jgi:hypothetical protein